MKKNIAIVFFALHIICIFAQNTPPIINIDYYSKWTHDLANPGESIYRHNIKNDAGKKINLNIYTRNISRINGESFYYGYLWSDFEYFYEEYPSEHITIPATKGTYRGDKIWIRQAYITIPNNVRIIDFEPNGYVYFLKLKIPENSKIEEIHVPKGCSQLGINISEKYNKDVIFFMESDSPIGDGKDMDKYYESNYKKCVFIVPKGSEENYNKLGRFKYARIYTSIEDYRAGKKHYRAQIEERKKAEEERKRREELARQERIRRENSVVVTIEPIHNENSIYITVDGKTMTDLWHDSLLIGEHIVSYTCMDYETASKKINVTRKDTVFTLPKMKRPPILYEFNSNRKQWGTRVYVNDTFVGRTPCSALIKQLEPNKIEYKADGYGTKTFFLTSDKHKKIALSSTPEKKQKKVNGVILQKDYSVIADLKKDRSGAIDKENGNAYVWVGYNYNSYPSHGLGITFGRTNGKHFNFDWLSLNLNFNKTGALLFQMGTKIGYSCCVGKYFRITPQIGLDLSTKLYKQDNDETYYSEYNNDFNGGNNRENEDDIEPETEPSDPVFNFPLGIKFEYAWWRWSLISVTPEAIWYSREKQWIWGVRVNLSIYNRSRQ